MQEQVNHLIKRNPAPSYASCQRIIGQLEKMANYYDQRQQSAPDKQAQMFGHFVEALEAAQDTIEKYSRLTVELAQLQQ